MENIENKDVIRMGSRSNPIHFGNTLAEPYLWKELLGRITSLDGNGKYALSATDSQISQVESLYECSMHPSIRDPLKFANGYERASWQPLYRLMSIAEILDFHEFWKQLGGVLTKWKLIFCWTNDNSDYAGVFCEGPLAGTVLLLAHEQAVWAPRFRGISEFLDTVKDESIDEIAWGRRVATFPLFLQNVSDSDVPMLESRVAECLKYAAAETDRDASRQFYETAIYLVHPIQIETMLPFLDIDDMWIPETAAGLIGKRRIETAIPNLVKLVLKGQGNGDSAAIRALGAIGTSNACEALKTLRGRTRNKHINESVEKEIAGFKMQ